MRRLWLGIAAAALLLLPAAPALAAQMDGPIFVASDPEAGAKMPNGPQEVEVTFSEPLAPSSQLRVVDECKRLIDDGSTIVTANSMKTRLKKTPSGTYTVYYRAKGPGGLSGETTGSFQFVVEKGRSCGIHEGHDMQGGKHPDGNKDHKGEGSHDTDDHESTDHSSTAHSKGRDGSDHSGKSHSGSRHGSGKRGGDHRGGKHGADHQGGKGEHGPNHEDPQEGGSEGNSTLAAAQGSRGTVGGVEGSAVVMALGAALLLGTAGGWLIRTKNLFL